MKIQMEIRLLVEFSADTIEEGEREAFLQTLKDEVQEDPAGFISDDDELDKLEVIAVSATVLPE